jgi:hypothetical protein
MHPGFEGQAEYLSLALFAQNLVATLAQFSKQHDLAELSQAIQETLTSLEDVQSGDVKKFGRQNAVAFNSYQQLSALNKAWAPADFEMAIQLMKEVLAAPTETGDARNQLVELFTRLQVQALWSFERPEAPPTEELRQLCRMTS